jgi:peptidoglycan/LPS O-acetylase OafA/YrhL
MSDMLGLAAFVALLTLPFTAGLAFAAWRASRSPLGFTLAQASYLAVAVALVYALLLERDRTTPWTWSSVGMLLALGGLPFAAALGAQWLARRDLRSPRLVGGITFGAGAFMTVPSASGLLGLSCVLARSSCL